MKILYRFGNLFLKFSRKISDDHIRAYSAEASFFAIMSFLPILMLLLSLIPYLPITEIQVLYILEEITPFEVTDLLRPILASLYRLSSGAVPWIVIVALWSAGKSIIGLGDGMNSIYRVEEERNYFLLRFRAMLYALVLIIALGVSLTIMVFGYDIIDYLKGQFHVLRQYSRALAVFPTLAAMLILVILFTIFYTFLPNRPQKMLKQIPGAVFASIAWTIFSYVFSIYLDMAGSLTVIYGSLTTMIGIMMWLYFCMYLLFVGAEVNHYLICPELFEGNNYLDRKNSYGKM